MQPLDLTLLNEKMCTTLVPETQKCRSPGANTKSSYLRASERLLSRRSKHKFLVSEHTHGMEGCQCKQEDDQFPGNSDLLTSHPPQATPLQLHICPVPLQALLVRAAPLR